MSWIIALIVLGIVLALVPMDGTMRNIILAVVLIAVVLSFFPGHGFYWPR